MNSENQPGETILKILTAAGIGSRRQAADIIKAGRVKVNDVVIEGFRHPVNPETDWVTVDGERVVLKPEARVYLILNKPKGIISTVSDDRARQSVLDIIPAKYHRLRLYPAGRLDRESTGLIILTNDGDLTYRLTHPKFEHEKEYRIRIEGALTPAEIARLETGIELEEGKTGPAKVREVDEPPFNYSLTLHEGRKRQVRRMLAAIGYTVLELKRVRLGGLDLGNLKDGECRELTMKEVRLLTTPPVKAKLAPVKETSLQRRQKWVPNRKTPPPPSSRH